MSTGERVLLIASKLGYATDDFVRAAERLGMELVLATDRCHVLAALWPAGALAIDFRNPRAAADTIAEHARERRFQGVIATDEQTAIIAAHARERLGLVPVATGRRPAASARAAGDKWLFRQQVSAAGVRQPDFVSVPVHASPSDIRAAMQEARLGYPVVLKPLHLSASRGIMRADDDRQLEMRLTRLQKLLADPEVRVKNPESAGRILIESFIAGREVAYEGLLQAGALRTLALFDKPEPLDGPFFAETMYVTPSAESDPMQRAIAEVVGAAAAAIGLREGPVHAELRLSASGPVVIELAARAIGGLCHRTLRFAGGTTLEELLLWHAAGREMTVGERQPTASGVYMLPVPRAGVLRAIHGVDAARSVALVTDVVMTARVGDTVQPLPEGHTYMGFVFAEAAERAAVIGALERAAGRIAFDIAARL